MNQRQIELFARLHNLLRTDTSEALARELNKRSRSQASGTFSRESVRRWSIGTQEFRKNNRFKLATILNCTPEQIESYFDGSISLDELLAEASIKALNTDFEELQNQIIDAAAEMSLPALWQLIAKLISICDRRWKDSCEQEQQFDK